MALVSESPSPSLPLSLLSPHTIPAHPSHPPPPLHRSAAGYRLETSVNTTSTEQSSETSPVTMQPRISRVASVDS